MQVVVVVFGLGGNNHLLCLILSEPMLVFLLFIYFFGCFIKRSSIASRTARGGSSVLVMDVRWASNKEELNFTRSIKKAV